MPGGNRETSKAGHIYGPKGEVLYPAPEPAMTITAKRDGLLARVWKAIFQS